CSCVPGSTCTVWRSRNEAKRGQQGPGLSIPGSPRIDSTTARWKGRPTVPTPDTTDTTLGGSYAELFLLPDTTSDTTSPALYFFEKSGVVSVVSGVGRKKNSR